MTERTWAGSARPMSPRRRMLARIVVAAWFAVNLGALVRGLLPAPERVRGPLPWGMFHSASSVYRTHGAYGVTPDGRRVDIPLERWFRYTRGATPLRVYDVPRVLDAAGEDDRRRFAEWLAAKMARSGVALASVTLFVELRDIAAGVTRTVSLGAFDVRDPR